MTETLEIGNALSTTGDITEAEPSGQVLLTFQAFQLASSSKNLANDSKSPRFFTVSLKKHRSRIDFKPLFWIGLCD